MTAAAQPTDPLATVTALGLFTPVRSYSPVNVDRRPAQVRYTRDR